MQWIKLSKYNLPPQGLKILCFRKGDLWIARRFVYKNKDYWIEIPYGGLLGAVQTDAPEYWVQVELLEGYTGYMRIGLGNEELITIDEFQEKDPESHEKFVEMIIENLNKIPPSKPLD